MHPFFKSNLEQDIWNNAYILKTFYFDMTKIIMYPVDHFAI